MFVKSVLAAALADVGAPIPAPVRLRVLLTPLQVAASRSMQRLSTIAEVRPFDVVISKILFIPEANTWGVEYLLMVLSPATDSVVITAGIVATSPVTVFDPPQLK